MRRRQPVRPDDRVFTVVELPGKHPRWGVINERGRLLGISRNFERVVMTASLLTRLWASLNGEIFTIPR